MIRISIGFLFAALLTAQAPAPRTFQVVRLKSAAR
jgi:hypothetical protein